jgi:hypothetical protein
MVNTERSTMVAHLSPHVEKQAAMIDTPFQVLGHRVNVLAYLFRFFALYVSDAV